MSLSARRFLTLIVSSAVLGLASCAEAQTRISGAYGAHDDASAAMLQLTQTDNGQISGVLSFVGLDKHGKIESSQESISGSFDNGQITLSIGRGFLGFGTKILAGTVHGNAISLQVIDNRGAVQSWVLSRTSEAQFKKYADELRAKGDHIAMVENANNALQEVEANDRQLNADLQGYIAWGQQRVNHVSDVRQWYADRTTHYTKCLQTIRPLAAQGIPSWRWQDCVLHTENDKYYRDQEAESIHDLQSQNQQAVSRLNARISTARQEFPKVVTAMNSACPFTKDVDSCTKTVRKLSLLLPDGFLDGKLVMAYNSTLPQVVEAIRTDEQISNQGESSLTAIAQQITKLYQHAR